QVWERSQVSLPFTGHPTPHGRGSRTGTGKRRTQQSSELEGQGPWMLDKLEVEQERSITVDVSLWKFETTKYYITINAPRHCHIIKNMINSTLQVDCVVLIVAAALLAYILGVKQLIRGVSNKMDAYIKIGYNPTMVAFVPISSWHRDMLEASPNQGCSIATREGDASCTTWLEALDSIILPSRPSNKPLCQPRQDIYKIGGEWGPPAESSCPGGNQTHDFPLACGPGVEIHQHHWTLIFQILCIVPFLLSFTSLLLLFTQVIILNYPGQISAGSFLVLDCRTAHIACEFAKLWEKTDRRSGKKLEDSPAELKSGDVATVQMIPSKLTCGQGPDPAVPSLTSCFAVQNMTQAVAVIKTMEEAGVGTSKVTRSVMKTGRK
uniref:Uncharacterized protein n=1 Tax=Crocodylus porosus TaxID=8502 RepID=A0A7M4FE40_CROPO